jgi:hypothetical protein
VTAVGIELMIARQDDLVRAMDARDLDGIEKATRALAQCVEQFGSVSGVRDTGHERAQVEHALKQSNALKMRVNTLTGWTRQRIDRLAELRGQPAPNAYENRLKGLKFR